MVRPRGGIRQSVLLWGSVCALLAGCVSLHHGLNEIGNGPEGYYRDLAACVAYPDLEPSPDVPAALTDERQIRPLDQVRCWPLELPDAVHLALQSNKLVRQNSQFLNRPNPLLASPQDVPSVYDPLIQENGTFFGQRGAPVAMADFDPLLTSSMTWGKSDQVQNNLFSSGLPPGRVLTQDTAAFRSRLDQPLTTGGVFSLFHTWDYDWNNSPTRLFPSAYNGTLGAEFRQPLWAGSGVDYNMTAGPLGNNNRFTPMNQGVVIAIINHKISHLDFESNVQILVRDVGEVYWQLAMAYRLYEAEASVRDKAKEIWDTVQAKLKAGTAGGSAADEAQAADTYFASVARTEDALAEIYSLEGRLRRMMGLPVDQTCLIRPSTDMQLLDISPSGPLALADALVRRTELRRQKSVIQSLQLQLKAALSLLRPRLDFVSRYQLNGFGDNLFGVGKAVPSDVPPEYASAYRTLFNGDLTSWTLGAEFSVPLYLRAERAQVKQFEFRLAKARAGLVEQEVEIGHEIAQGIQAIERYAMLTRANEERAKAAQRRIDASLAEYNAARVSVDLVLRAEISYLEARTAYVRTLAEYNRALVELQYRQGTILDQHGVLVWSTESLPPTLSAPLPADTVPALESPPTLEPAPMQETAPVLETAPMLEPTPVLEVGPELTVPEIAP